MNTFWQRVFIFCFIGLPLKWSTVRSYWWAVILWIAFLIVLNILLYGQMMHFQNYLDNLVNPDML
jgi:NhaP-type Na+/H+ or K+/H+ antiporter